jgi:hypothetical protein
VDQSLSVEFLRLADDNDMIEAVELAFKAPAGAGGNLEFRPLPRLSTSDVADAQLARSLQTLQGLTA